MGILNITPDSFSDGGQWLTSQEECKLDAVLAHAQWLIDHGCSVLDVGGESTRPGADDISVDVETNRVVPVIQALRAQFPHIAISIDTRKALVAKAALQAGASIVNDVSGLTFDAAMAWVVANADAQLILMHSQGVPSTMQQQPHYNNVVDEVFEFLQQQSQWAIAQGIGAHRIVWDVGFGFGKTAEHNLQLLAHLNRFAGHGFPVLLGTSRKSFLVAPLSTEAAPPPPPEQRDVLTAATAFYGLMAGCSWFRVHHPECIRPVLALAQATSSYSHKEVSCAQS